MSLDRSTPIEIFRDCDATLIPSGERVTLHRGEQVLVTQALGASVTVQTDRGHLARISGADAVSLGLVDSIEQDTVADGDARSGAEFELEQVIDQLKTVFDPEIPVNVVDLGLIYSCEAQPLPNGMHRIEIKMSMTAPGCGMGDVLKDDAYDRVAAVPGVGEVDVELIWDPPWELSRMSDAARLELGMM